MRSIALCGASGTGKSTIAHALANDYNVNYCPVGARYVAKYVFHCDNPYELDALGQRDKFQKCLFEMKKEWEEDKSKGFVTDRTHIDNLVYTIMHGSSCLSLEDISSMIEACKVYDYIFFFPLEKFQSLNGDVARIKNVNYHYVYEFLLKSILGNSGLKYHELQTVKVADRIDEIRGIVSDL